MTGERTPGVGRHLALGTFAFGVCFAAWGLISAFAARFRERLGLSGTETALLIAVPVLLGALARLPMGILSDRFGGRVVFTVLMAVVAVPVYLVPASGDLPLSARRRVLARPRGLLLRRWRRVRLAVEPARKQGSAAGRIRDGEHRPIGGGVPRTPGWRRRSAGRTSSVPWRHCWSSALGFALLARDAPARAAPKGIGAMVTAPVHERLSWALAAFYFLTFGGFVAFSIYLPTLLKDDFGLTPADAGFRTAGFVVLATLLRPVGGALSDRIGGARVLSAVFLGSHPVRPAPGLAVHDPVHGRGPGLRGAPGARQRRRVQARAPVLSRRTTGTVTGLVGAMGGLGGFFPPLLLGMFRDRTGRDLARVRSAGAHGLRARRGSTLASSCREQEAAELRRCPPELRRVAERLRAGGWATMVTGLLVAAIVVGSRNLQNFDAALVIYTFAVVFASWGVAYHYAVWLQNRRPACFGTWLAALARERGLLASSLRLARADRRRTSSGRPSSARGPRCDGGCTSASSGGASWPWRSRSRWCSGGSTSEPRPTTRCVRHLRLRVPHRIRSACEPSVLVPVPRSRRGRRPGADRDRPLAVAPHARPGRAGGAVVRHGLLSAVAPLRDLGDRARADRLDAVAARRSSTAFSRSSTP